MRLMGIRELTQGTGILTRPRPTMWLWSRVAGDAVDLSLLGLIGVKNRRARTAGAVGKGVGGGVPGIFESPLLGGEEGQRGFGGGGPQRPGAPPARRGG